MPFTSYTREVRWCFGCGGECKDKVWICNACLKNKPWMDWQAELMKNHGGRLPQPRYQQSPLVDEGQ